MIRKLLLIFLLAATSAEAQVMAPPAYRGYTVQTARDHAQGEVVSVSAYSDDPSVTATLRSATGAGTALEVSSIGATRYAAFLPENSGLHTVTWTARDIRQVVNVPVVATLPESRVLGLQSRRGLVVAWPASVLSSAGAGAVNALANNTRTFFNDSYKARIPWTGRVYQVRASFGADAANVVSWRFIVLRKAGGEWLLRARSADIARPTTGAETTYNLPNEVYAQAGDYYGVEVTSGAADARMGYYLFTGDYAKTATHNLRYFTGACPPQVPATTLFPNPAAIAVKPVMMSPEVAIAGHSIQAGHTASHTFYEDTANDWSENGDPARWLEKFTGVSVVNVAIGGTNISYNSNGWNNTDVTGGTIELVKAAVVLFNCHYNDSNFTVDADWLRHYDSFLAKCDSVGSELVLCEGYVPTATIAAGTSLANQRRIDNLRAWATLNRVGWIPMAHRIGFYTGATSGSDPEDPGWRWSIKKGQTYATLRTMPTYTSDDVHLNAAGQKAMAMAMAAGLRNRGPSPLEGKLGLNPDILGAVVPPHN